MTLPDSGAGTRFMWIPDRSALRAGTVSSSDWNNGNIGPYSFAIGLELKVTGLAAGAVGYQNISSGLQSFSGGFNNKAEGNQSMAFGLSNSALGNISVAVGNNNKINLTGLNAVAIGQSNNIQSSNNYLIGVSNQGKNEFEFAFGYNNSVSAARSFSFGNDNDNSGVNSYNFGETNSTIVERSMNIGFDNLSSGIRALAIGSGNSPTGDRNISLGTGNKGEGSESVEIGSFNKANGNSSFSAGFGIVNNVFGATMLGMFNDSLTADLAGGSLSKSIYDANDPLFIIGNGINNKNRSNALTLYKNGRLGLGTNTPSQLLDINGSARIRSLITDNSNNTFVTVENDGTLKKTTINLSDRRLKQNIQPLENALEKVIALSGKSYEFKEYPNQPRIGFIAQDVETVLPEVVFENDEGLKGVRYQEIVALLTEALKVQQQQIESLKTKVTELEQNQLVISSKND